MRLSDTKLMAAFAAAMFLALSCGEKASLKEVFPEVSLSNVPDGGFNVGADAKDTLYFDIVSDAGWTIGQKDAQWITTEPRDGGPGRTTVKVYANERNLGIIAREGTLTVQAKDFNSTIRVGQDAAEPYFIVEGATDSGLMFESIPEAVVLGIRGNVGWTMSVKDLDWCGIMSSVNGKCPAEITVLPSGNLGMERSGSLTIIPEQGLDPVVVTISQKKVAPFIELDLSAIKFDFIGAALSANVVNVSSNVSWSVSASEGWVHFDKNGADGETSLAISVDENTICSKRTATVTIESGMDASATIKVEQDAMPYYSDLSVEPVLWKTNDWEYIEKHSPDWSTAGINAYSRGTGMGIALPEGDAAMSSIMKWEVVGTGATQLYTPSFVTTKEGHYTVKYMFTDDAYVFTVAVQPIKAGKQLCMSFKLQGNQYCPLHYILEFCVDGENWVAAQTGSNYTTTALGVPANIQLAKDKALEVTGTYTLPAAVGKGFIKARVRVADGVVTIDGKTYTYGKASSTLRIHKPANYDGPAIYVK